MASPEPRHGDLEGGVPAEVASGNDRLRKMKERRKRRSEPCRMPPECGARLATLENGDFEKLASCRCDAQIRTPHFTRRRRPVKKSDLLAALLGTGSVSEAAITPALVKGRRSEIGGCGVARLATAAPRSSTAARGVCRSSASAGRRARRTRARARARARGGDGNADGAAQNVFPRHVKRASSTGRLRDNVPGMAL